MSAINFPLTTDISSAANQVSSQNAERLPAGGSGHSTVLRPDTVTLSAVFPPPPPVDAANFVQFQSPAQPALEAFPPAAAQTSGAPTRLAPASNAAAAPTPTQQEQLAQLDRVLEQLGISPQSISLDNRLALIKSVNDPPAVLNLVRTLGVLNEAATSAQISAVGANNLSNPDPIGNQSSSPSAGPGSSPFPRGQAGREHSKPVQRGRFRRDSRAVAEHSGLTPPRPSFHPKSPHIDIGLCCIITTVKYCFV